MGAARAAQGSTKFGQCFVSSGNLDGISLIFIPIFGWVTPFINAKEAWCEPLDRSIISLDKGWRWKVRTLTQDSHYNLTPRLWPCYLRRFVLLVCAIYNQRFVNCYNVWFYTRLLVIIKHYNKYNCFINIYFYQIFRDTTVHI